MGLFIGIRQASSTRMAIRIKEVVSNGRRVIEYASPLPSPFQGQQSRHEKPQKEAARPTPRSSKKRQAPLPLPCVEKHVAVGNRVHGRRNPSSAMATLRNPCSDCHYQLTGLGILPRTREDPHRYLRSGRAAQRPNNPVSNASRSIGG